MPSRSCFSNTCTDLTRSAGSAEIKCASAVKSGKRSMFVLFVLFCFEGWRSAVCVWRFGPGFDFLLLETILALHFFAVVLLTVAMPKHGNCCAPQCQVPKLWFHTFASDSELKIHFRIPQRRRMSSCHQAGWAGSCFRYHRKHCPVL